MFIHIFKSALWGFLASLVVLAVGFAVLMTYLHHLVHSQQPGIGFAFGGLLPLLTLSILAFTVVFLWNLIRRLGTQRN
jgi:hypothetical protein